VAPVAVDDIRAAARRIDGRVLRTAVRQSEWLSALSGSDVYLKLEVVQPTSSYKIRGAFNAALMVHERGAGTAPAFAKATAGRPRLVTASAGNHGRALAHAARALRLPLTVFIAANAPRAKTDAIRAAGAELRECTDYDEAERQAKSHAAGGGGLYISPYSHPDVIAGAGTIALELLEDLAPLDTVIVPVGGGGLISGIAIAMKALSPSTRVVGVEASASCPFSKSLAAGRLVTIDVGPSIADGLTGNLDPDTITLDIVRNLVDQIVTVDEPLLRRALAGVVANEHLVIEGAAAAGPAAILAGQIELKGNVAVILTGANIDTTRLTSILL
jgi:threonine dehydratase